VHPLTGLFLASLPFLLGGCGLPVGVAIASYAADGVLLLATDKTSGDHLVSMGSGKDCAMWRVIKGREICVDRKPGEENPYNVDHDAPHREVGEGGIITVYAASRQGGRMLTDEEAKLALAPKPTTIGSQPPPGEPSQAGPAVAAQRTTEVADAAARPAPAIPRARQQSPVPKTATKTGRSVGKKGTVPARRSVVIAERRSTPKSFAKTARARRDHAAPRGTSSKTRRDRSPVESAGR
jgi:hypothetical protein